MDESYRVGSADPNFAHLLDKDIPPEDGHLTKPGNWNELLAMVAQPRPTIPSEPYDARYREFL